MRPDIKNVEGKVGWEYLNGGRFLRARMILKPGRIAARDGEKASSV